MRTRDETRHARRKADIIAAAAACFAKRGVRQTTMQEICTAVGLSPGALYRYFASKEDIIASLAREEAQSLQELTHALQAAPDVVTGLRQVLPDVVEAVSSPHYGRLALELAAEAARTPAVGAPFLESEATFAAELTALLEDGKAHGAVAADVDPEAMAFMIRCLLDGLSANAAFALPVSRPRVLAALCHVLEAALRPPAAR